MCRDRQDILKTMIAVPIWVSMLLSSGLALGQEFEKALSIRIELNKVENVGENCRTYFKVDNRNGGSWNSLKLDLFALDTNGVAAKRMALEIGPVPERKTLIKLFDFPALSCDHLGQVLLNDVLACNGRAGSREECLAAIDTTSKVATVPFAK
ncbi:Tat pathway signal protein [Microvirga puerhi]|uniref:Tat pathway signal protein n=1 Tax=Microvirga puerhi TaxID=2876078 RepID=A0ABS7VPP3_9HYPH|nr:Tat pathway signal protein [Microvirga puerhi]MBZ6076987.1 Tat pathway signal protein [Microvirga puerhi]